LQPDILESIKTCATRNEFPDKTHYIGISVKDIQTISHRFKIPQREIEIASLKEGVIPQRYVRNFRSFSPSDQMTLLSKTVCIVGLGGLGGGVMEILARLGIGRLILIDGDFFENSNLNRQLLSTEKNIGQSKALIAAERIRQVNSSVETTIHGIYLDEPNAVDLMKGADVVVDCLDNIKTRFIVEHAAKALKIPMVSGAVAGASGQVTVIFPETRGLEAIYGNHENLPEKGIETSTGTLPFTVTLVSTLECAEVIKILLQKAEALRNKLLFINPLENLYEVMSL
jgi:molybdopterin/thiamine biosynthesis adenylyltransferase